MTKNVEHLNTNRNRMRESITHPVVEGLGDGNPDPG
jgi:hypothetical protein